MRTMAVWDDLLDSFDQVFAFGLEVDPFSCTKVHAKLLLVVTGVLCPSQHYINMEEEKTRTTAITFRPM